MTTALFPDNTLINRLVAKSKFVEKLRANTRMKEHFTRDVVSIEWLAKLAPSTLNVADGHEVHEITVFRMPLKVKQCPDDLFLFIDKQMPRHTLFLLEYEDEACLLINYKQALSGSSENAYRVIRTFRSPWQKAEALCLNLSHHSMDALYESLVRQVAGASITSKADNLQEAIQQTAQQEALCREVAALERRIAAELQPQRKFALHKQLIELKNRLHHG